VAIESAHFCKVQENLNYSADALLRVWPTHFNKLNVDQYAHNPQKIANRAYANRMGNGDEASGDGWRYAGKGLIQLTGKDNYRHFGQSSGLDVLNHPELLLVALHAVESACWFWTVNDLNHYADLEDITSISKHINGGALGLTERKAMYAVAKSCLH
jgi:putative chitinase